MLRPSRYRGDGGYTGFGRKDSLRHGCRLPVERDERVGVAGMFVLLLVTRERVFRHAVASAVPRDRRGMPASEIMPALRADQGEGDEHEEPRQALDERVVPRRRRPSAALGGFRRRKRKSLYGRVSGVALLG